MVSSSWQHSLAGDPGDGVALLPGATGLFPLLRGRVLLGFALSHAHFQIAPFCAQELPTGHTQCLELFAGVAVIASAWRKAGYSSRALDLDRTWPAFKRILASQTFKFRHSLIEAAMRLLNFPASCCFCASAAGIMLLASSLKRRMFFFLSMNASGGSL